MKSLLFGLTAAFLLACSASRDQKPVDPSQPAISPGEAPAHWSGSLSQDEQVAIMKQRVTPALARVFRAGDADALADFGCESCHGPSSQSPTRYLPTLALENGRINAFTTDPEVSEFMANRVVPEMAAALGLQPYDPATGQGFGCAGCHTLVP